MPITSRFDHRSTALDVVEGLDLHGTVAVVTGGTSGIGVETVRALASAGADVTIAARDIAAAETLVRALEADLPGATLHVLELDLADQASARRAAASFLQRDTALHVLVNNAGVMATPLARTADGFELQFGTNHLGHFTFTTALEEPLRRADGARVVSLSSIGHRRSDLVEDDPNYERRPYDRWEAYGQSKTANALFAVGLTARLGAGGVFANAVMPGGILTGLQKHLTRDEQVELGWMDPDGTPNPRFKTSAQGAATSVWAAVGAELDGVGGRYLENCAEAEPMDPARPFVGFMPYAVDPARAERLWALSEELTLT